VVLSLAHLLKQQHPHQDQDHALTVDYYEIEKAALLTASVQCATGLANAAKEAEAAMTTTGTPPMTTTTVGEVHLIMTGSPRPTFAETNAWLLEDAQQQQQKQEGTPEKKKGDGRVATGGETKRPESLAGSLSILDNHVSFATVTKNDEDEDNDEEEEEEEGEGNNLEQLLLSNATPARSTAGVGEAAIVNTNFIRRHTAPASSSTTFAGPMVGQAVVNAINQTHGVGLQSNRSKLLQGTIDRPEWIQSRWTDGECVFGELVHLCGLHSFENTSAGSSGYYGGNTTTNSLSSLTEEKKDDTSSPSSSKHHQLRKTTNLSAHLITVPVILSTTTTTVATAKAATTSSKGMEEETMEEIARGILRCLKRKGSTSVTNIYLLVPPSSSPTSSSSSSRKDKEGSAAAEAAAIITSALLKKAFDKLEQYNDMIGMSRLMDNVCFEVVPVVL
jgi:hypothetical protein